jgi:hypothetical protein
MNQYLLLIHRNAETEAKPEEWTAFFDAARQSGIFRGGSELGEGDFVGAQDVEKLSKRLAGYMRFDADDKQRVLELLDQHPVVIHGGTVELCALLET